MTEEQAHKQAKREREFYGHLASYLIVNSFLAALNLITDPGTIWFIFPVLSWGIGLAAHAVSVFGLPGRGPDWEARRVQELMGGTASADQVRSLLSEELQRREPRRRASADEARLEREALRERIEHLEAIVTSHDWDALEGTRMPPAANPGLQPGEPADEASLEERAARLARRVR